MTVAIIYWSGTGNTEAMAKALSEGVTRGGGTPELLSVDAANPEEALAADALALGCPAMGDEVLEEGEMEPFVEALEKSGLSGKRLVLFGSYDWGEGEWMRSWESRMKAAGADLLQDGIIAQNSPGQEILDALGAAGAALASA